MSSHSWRVGWGMAKFGNLNTCDSEYRRDEEKCSDCHDSYDNYCQEYPCSPAGTAAGYCR